MRICFVCGQTVRDFSEKESGEKADLFLFGFNGIKEVCYEEELKGETNFFEKAALFSKKEQAVVISGCVTNTMGHKRKSAVIAEKGKLKGVSDALYTMDEKISCGASLRVYETGIGRIGVAVAEDLHFPEVIKALSDCSSDLIVCPYAQVRNSLPSVLLRANAYFYGTPILFCGDGCAMLANTKGELVCSSPTSPMFFEFENRAEYHLVQRRRRLVKG